jgi:hypothetical protein
LRLQLNYDLAQVEKDADQIRVKRVPRRAMTDELRP